MIESDLEAALLNNLQSFLLELAVVVRNHADVEWLEIKLALAMGESA